MKDQFYYYRPQDFTGSGDAYLFPLVLELKKLLTQSEKKYTYKTLWLDNERRFLLASLLIEFAEDLHNDIGLWKSIESYNKLTFNTPLPFFVDENAEIEHCFDKNRIKYFLYTIFPELIEDLILSPKHKDLGLIAEFVSDFLVSKFKDVPKDSGVKMYLSSPNQFGWDFKRKLIWTGLSSYLFRLSSNNYIKVQNKSESHIAIIDDFVCQECSIWSGLCVTDVLAKAAGLPLETQNQVVGWYERLFSYYRAVSTKNLVLEIENIVNNQRYKLQLGDEKESFKNGEVVFGSIVPFGEYYYWSGMQRYLGIIDDETIKQLKKDFVKKTSKIVYRFDKQLLAEAVESTKKHYSDFVDFFGDDLVVFKDGLAMAAALQQKDRKLFEALPPDILRKHMEKNNLSNPYPRMNFPKDILDCNSGLALYYNPEVGMEIMVGFDTIERGLDKNGVGLSEKEKNAIQNFIFSESISANFVLKVAEENGFKSILSSFLLDTEMDNISFLLHKYKGRYYRNHYPELSFNID